MLVDMDEVASATFSFTGTAASTHTLTPDNNSHLLILVSFVNSFPSCQIPDLLSKEQLKKNNEITIVKYLFILINYFF